MPQGKNQDMIEAANESRVVFKVLQEERDEKMLWDEQFERAREMAGEWNNDPRITRLTANQHTQTVLAKSTLLISSRSLDTRAQWRVLNSMIDSSGSISSPQSSSYSMWIQQTGSIAPTPTT